METCDAFWELMAQCMSFFDTGKRNMNPPPPPFPSPSHTLLTSSNSSSFSGNGVFYSLMYYDSIRFIIMTKKNSIIQYTVSIYCINPKFFLIKHFS